jgi:flagella basal body P-ring formation protein FlgA
MKKFTGLIATTILAGGYEAVLAEDIVAARNIRAGSLIVATDIVTPQDRDALRRAIDIVGMEAGRTFYQGQPIDETKLRAPTLIKRNTIVQMEYARGPMTISAEGRALDPGGLGDRIRVMNLGSKRIVTVVVTGENAVRANL